MLYVYMLDTHQKPTTGELDPDMEVQSWEWIPFDDDKKLPPRVMNNLQHNPNVTLDLIQSILLGTLVL